MLEYLVEFIGTFIFLSMFIITGSPTFVGFTLAVMVWVGKKFSVGNFNPVFSLMLFMNDKLNLKQLALQIVAQLLGGIAAFYYYKIAQ